VVPRGSFLLPDLDSFQQLFLDHASSSYWRLLSVEHVFLFKLHLEQASGVPNRTTQ